MTLQEAKDFLALPAQETISDQDLRDLSYQVTDVPTETAYPELQLFHATTWPAEAEKKTIGRGTKHTFRKRPALGGLPSAALISSGQFVRILVNNGGPSSGGGQAWATFMNGSTSDWWIQPLDTTLPAFIHTGPV